jgi:molecular chaperone DnaK
MTNVKPRAGGALLGLAAIVLLAASLLAVVVYRSATGPGSGANDVRLGWQAAVSSPGAAALARPVALGSGLVLLTSDGAAQVIGDVSVSAWSSSDGSSWSRLSQPGAISEPGRSIMIVATCADGHGGLVAGGTSAIASDPTLALQATIWHSSDGRTWDPATVDGDVGASVEDVAVGPDALVAVGLAQPDNAGTSRGLAWYSGDGMTWHSATVSDSDGYSLLAVAAWRGGFLAIGSGTGGRAAAWTSADGRGWTLVASLPEMFEAHRIVAFGDRIVVVGSLAGKPETLTSGDARTWTQAAMPLDATAAQASVWVSDAVDVDGRLVAVGYSAIAVVPEATSVPPPRPFVWVSGDGLSWRLLSPDTTLTGSLNGAAVLGDHVVVTTRDSAGSPIYVGTPAG